jgi:diaminohydroxyphosphoribosylaminopyrimidine deaminase/5-amino-6-(5-phosphoribosylamino)uracil reductase
LAQTAKSVPTWVITASDAVSQGQRLADLGVNIIPIHEADDGKAFIAGAASMLAQMGLTRVLIEGGGQIAAAFLGECLVDEVAWFRAGRIMGGEGRPAIGALPIAKLADAPTFAHVYSLALGTDCLDMFERVR